MEDTYAIIRKHKWKIILSFALAAFIIFAITFLVGLSDIITILSQANWYFVLLNLLLEALILIIWTLRWKLILKTVNQTASFRSLFLMLLASIFGNNVTPGAAGGEPLRAYLLREVNRTPFEIGFATATADRVFEFFPFVLISVFAAFLILTWNIPIWTRLIVFVLIVISIFFFGIVLYTVFKKELALRVIIRVSKSIYPFFVRLAKTKLSFAEVREKLVYYVNRFSHGFLQVIKDRKVFILGFIISFIMWGLDIARFYVCFVAIGAYPPIMPLLIIYTIGILIMLIPILPGGWGIREATIVGLFGVVGVAGDVVLAASLIDRLASYIIPTFIGAFIALYYGKYIRDLKKSAEKSIQ
jgi:glycosyltransferase 2 family protein